MIQREAGVPGRACILSGCRHVLWSRDKMRTVLSSNPSARNCDVNASSSTGARAIAVTFELRAESHLETEEVRGG